MDKLDFLSGQPSAEPAAAPEAEAQASAPAAVEAPAAEGPARDAGGRFASSAAAPVVEPQAASASPAASSPAQEPPTAAHVPIGALMDERDKRKAAEERLRTLEAQRQPVAVPDRFQDPEGYQAYRDAEVTSMLENQRLDMSERFARKEHGAELVDQVKAWAVDRFARDPLFHQKILADPDPYEAAVQEWKRDQIVSQVTPSDLEQFRAWQAAQAAAANPQAAPAAAASQQPVAPPPRSLASATSAGGGGVATTPVGQGQAFDSLFRKQ